MARRFKCPFCGATDSVSKGVRKTKTMGDRRIRLCKGCGRKFTPKNQKQAEASGSGTEEQEENQRREAEEPAEPNAVSQEDTEAPDGTGAPDENETPNDPADALACMFSPPDERWTS